VLPSRSRGKFLTIVRADSRPPGDCIKYSCSVYSHSKLFLTTQSALINECDAPELKSITAGWPLTRNVPAITGAPAGTSEISVKFTRPVCIAPLFFWLAGLGRGTCAGCGAELMRRGRGKLRAKWPGLPQL